MWTATTIAHVATTATVAIIVKSGIAVDFGDFAITIPSFPTLVNGIHRECVLAVTAKRFSRTDVHRSLRPRSLPARPMRACPLRRAALFGL